MTPKPKLLDEDREFVLTVGAARSVSLVPTVDGTAVVLTCEDPHSVAVVELTQAELGELVDAARKLF